MPSIITPAIQYSISMILGAYPTIRAQSSLGISYYKDLSSRLRSIQLLPVFEPGGETKSLKIHKKRKWFRTIEKTVRMNPKE